MTGTFYGILCGRKYWMSNQILDTNLVKKLIIYFLVNGMAQLEIVKSLEFAAVVKKVPSNTCHRVVSNLIGLVDSEF